MSLRRKILFKDFALLVGLVAMIGACLWGLLRQQSHVRASLGELSALHEVELAQSKLLAFQQSVHAAHPIDADAVANLRGASLNLRRYKAIVSQYDNVLPPEIPADLQSLVRSQTRHAVSSVIRISSLTEPPTRATPLDRQAIAAEVDQLTRDVGSLLAMCNGFVSRTEQTSNQDLQAATLGVSAIAGLALVGSIAASFWQHRQITTPLMGLRQWCRRTASGNFSVRYEPGGDREFRDLATDVNRMATELDAFYERLEGLVATKSRELVRSERLAGLGYLAAGVAHEINTPLNVMSGYAELSLRRLSKSSDDLSADDELAEHLSIIRAEAFRCKQITQKLLSLARGDGTERSIVNVITAIEDVAEMVRGLRNFQGKQLQIAAAAPTLNVLASATELKQVLLNLIVNAVEAVSAGIGEVKVTAREAGRWIELVVADNGRGMSDHTREQVFEPFFTDKRGGSEPGTGLGLSVTHAIVTDHGGRITAFSDGPGLGSRFTVLLPATAEEGS